MSNARRGGPGCALFGARSPADGRAPIGHGRTELRRAHRRVPVDTGTERVARSRAEAARLVLRAMRPERRARRARGEARSPGASGRAGPRVGARRGSVERPRPPRAGWTVTLRDGSESDRRAPGPVARRDPRGRGGIRAWARAARRGQRSRADARAPRRVRANRPSSRARSER